jgi:hypothetical protein
MNRMRHGRVSFDIPDDWNDRSTLLFVGPPPSLPTANAARMPQPSMTMTFARTKGEHALQEARAILDEELAGLAAMNVGLEVLKMEEFETAIGKGALSTHRLSLEGLRLLQLQVVVVTGQIAVRAAASGDGSPASEDALRKILASLSMEATP